MGRNEVPFNEAPFKTINPLLDATCGSFNVVRVAQTMKRGRRTVSGAERGAQFRRVQCASLSQRQRRELLGLKVQRGGRQPQGYPLGIHP